MSTNLELSSRVLHLGARGIALSKLRASFGVTDAPRPTNTPNVNTVRVSHIKKNWLDSVTGAFNGNPLAALIMENEREARRQDDEHFSPIE